LWAGFEYRNRDILKDKLRSISIEIKEKLVRQESVSGAISTDRLRTYLDKFSHIFYTDINVFDQQGSLVSSSISNVFQQGIISEKMNPVAFQKLSLENTSEYLQREKIGDLRHLSGYIPLYQDDGSFLAYLHLPYFLKNEAFRIEWTYFITSILNIYVIIFMLFFFIVALLGEWITQPLKRIKELISNISLDDNKVIVYTKHDELGDLITLYNKKVEELREKSNELSMVEKEMAWNEMARQIAHEIKNPLTPMKLSVQHLSRILKTEDQDTLKKFERLMIEQIDALAQVASDFGDFAKTDRISLSEFVLEDIIKPVVQLYSGTHTNLVVDLKSSHVISVMADKDQMTRVFNNLIKNAVQSIPKEERGLINISLEQQENNVLVQIHDNGKGIPDEIKPKLFTPNFTTKSEGTGLGLAIVKKIIEQHHGEIWFESELGKGSTFFLRIPVYKQV
jgi:two-component system nitrogen regulation sensor histidine kinase NtrY